MSAAEKVNLYSRKLAAVIDSARPDQKEVVSRYFFLYCEEMLKLKKTKGFDYSPGLAGCYLGLRARFRAKFGKVCLEPDPINFDHGKRECVLQRLSNNIAILKRQGVLQ